MPHSLMRHNDALTISAIVFDVGMTLIHVDGEVLAREIARANGSEVNPRLAKTAFYAALDARDIAIPPNATKDERIALRWGALIGIPPGCALDAFTGATASRDLYGPVESSAHSSLESLRRAGIRLAALANADGNLASELERAELLDYFDVAVDSTEIGVEKPDSRAFHITAERLEVPEPRCAHVGDDFVNDYLGSLGAGFGASILFDPLNLRLEYPSISRIQSLDHLSNLITL